VGTLLDTTVFIDLERAVRLLPPESATAEVSGRPDEQPRPDEEAGIAAITAAGLLLGVHCAAPEGRDRREAFIKAALEAFPPPTPSSPSPGTCDPTPPPTSPTSAPTGTTAWPRCAANASSSPNSNGYPARKSPSTTPPDTTRPGEPGSANAPPGAAACPLTDLFSIQHRSEIVRANNNLPLVTLRRRRE
jgi:hypothetical protein